MSHLRTALIAVMALALVASGLSWGVMSVRVSETAAISSAAAGEAGAHGACHESADAATAGVSPDAPDASMDCCDGAACACGCLHHAPAAFSILVIAMGLPLAQRPPVGHLGFPATAPVHPQLRPPIA